MKTKQRILGNQIFTTGDRTTCDYQGPIWELLVEFGWFTVEVDQGRALMELGR